MPAQAIWWDLEASSVGAQARRLRRLSEEILECGYTAIKTNLMALEDLEGEALASARLRSTQLSEHFFDHGDILLNHAVPVAAMHADIDDIVRFDMIEGVFESHYRIDTAGCHDLVGDAGGFDGPDALGSRLNVAQLELQAAAIVEAATVEEGHRVEVGDSQASHPKVGFGGVRGHTNGDTMFTGVVEPGAQGVLIPFRIQVVDSRAVEVERSAADVDNAVDGLEHGGGRGIADLGDPLQLPDSGQVFVERRHDIRRGVVGDHGVDPGGLCPLPGLDNALGGVEGDHLLVAGLGLVAEAAEGVGAEDETSHLQAAEIDRLDRDESVSAHTLLHRKGLITPSGS